MINGFTKFLFGMLHEYKSIISNIKQRLRLYLTIFNFLENVIAFKVKRPKSITQDF